MDYVIINKKIHPFRMLDVRTLSSVNTTTNHNMVIAKIRSHIQPKKKCKTKTIEKINVEALSNKIPLPTEISP